MASEDDFCAEMREKTQAIHDKSDRLVNLKLAVALTDTKIYANVLADFYFVFQTIESCMNLRKDHPDIAPLINPKMYRTDAFERDLEFYMGEDWKKNLDASENAKLYCKRITQISAQDPTLLIAYIHSMYMALVAGGSIIKKIVKKTLGLSNNEGLSIFEFEDTNRSELRNHIYSAINGLELDRVKKDAIIQEKIRVFFMNNKIASAVSPSVKSVARLVKLILMFILLLALVCLLIAFLFAYMF